MYTTFPADYVWAMLRECNPNHLLPLPGIKAEIITPSPLLHVSSGEARSAITVRSKS
jgi:hypothetical protein